MRGDGSSGDDFGMIVRPIVWFGSFEYFLRREEEGEDMPIDLRRMKRETADCSLCIR